MGIGTEWKPRTLTTTAGARYDLYILRKTLFDLCNFSYLVYCSHGILGSGIGVTNCCSTTGVFLQMQRSGVWSPSRPPAVSKM